MNLTEASTVIILDVSPNPQQDAQAVARSWRQGQSKQVLVLYLVVVGTNYKRSTDYTQALRSGERLIQANKVLDIASEDVSGAFENEETEESKEETEEKEEFSIFDELSKRTKTLSEVQELIENHDYDGNEKYLR